MISSRGCTSAISACSISITELKPPESPCAMPRWNQECVGSRTTRANLTPLFLQSLRKFSGFTPPFWGRPPSLSFSPAKPMTIVSSAPSPSTGVSYDLSTGSPAFSRKKDASSLSSSRCRERASRGGRLSGALRAVAGTGIGRCGQAGAGIVAAPSFSYRRPFRPG